LKREGFKIDPDRVSQTRGSSTFLPLIGAQDVQVNKRLLPMNNSVGRRKPHRLTVGLPEHDERLSFLDRRPYSLA
jgi:hypothetical protein